MDPVELPCYYIGSGSPAQDNFSLIAKDLYSELLVLLLFVQGDPCTAGACVAP